MVSWLVSLFSKEPYYANYERNLEKIALEVKDLQELRRQREDRKSTLVASFWQYGLIMWAGSVGYAFWIQQLEEGVLSPQQHAIRVAPALLLLPLLFIANFVLNTLLSMGDKRNQARLMQLQRSKKKTIQDLKEYTKFDKVFTIIKQYDPENVPRMVNNQQAPKNQGKPQGTNVKKQNGMHQEVKKEGGKIQQSESVPSRLLPLFDRFAGLMGDNPGLLAELSHVKQALYEAQDRAKSAEEEVIRLKQELTILKGEQEDYQFEGLIDTLDIDEEPHPNQLDQIQEEENITNSNPQQNNNEKQQNDLDLDSVDNISKSILLTQENNNSEKQQSQVSDAAAAADEKNRADEVADLGGLESYSTAQEQCTDNVQQ